MSSPYFLPWIQDVFLRNLDLHSLFLPLETANVNGKLLEYKIQAKCQPQYNLIFESGIA